MKWSVTRTIFPFQPMFSRNILPISKIFLVSKSSSVPLSDLTVFNFQKSLNFEPFFPYLIFPPIEISKTISKIWFSISNTVVFHFKAAFWVTRYLKTNKIFIFDIYDSWVMNKGVYIKMSRRKSDEPMIACNNPAIFRRRLMSSRSMMSCRAYWRMKKKSLSSIFFALSSKDRKLQLQFLTKK